MVQDTDIKGDHHELQTRVTTLQLLPRDNRLRLLTSSSPVIASAIRVNLLLTTSDNLPPDHRAFEGCPLATSAYRTVVTLICLMTFISIS